MAALKWELIIPVGRIWEDFLEDTPTERLSRLAAGRKAAGRLF